jgi:hypothetical protein
MPLFEALSEALLAQPGRSAEAGFYEKSTEYHRIAEVTRDTGS